MSDIDHETYEEGKDRVVRLYKLLLEEFGVGVYTMQVEMKKPAAERNCDYLINQERLNVALENAIFALEQSGWLDKSVMVTRIEQAPQPVPSVNKNSLN